MRVAVGLSGGVDSSVAAAMLKEQGHDVVGLFMRISEPIPGKIKGCYGSDQQGKEAKARAVAEALGIPFHALDLTKEYRSIVMEHLVSEYVSGRTPNPCLRCNPLVKFGAMLDIAMGRGIAFDKFATGHYARVDFDPATGRYLLKKAADSTKDQSYGLIFLTQEQLAGTIFPLGGITKREVRRIAEKLGLGTHEEPESQDFYDGDISDLINAEPKPGKIIDASGSVVGEHKGVWHYTIGQRRGLGVSAGEPVYVKAIDAEKNTISVGNKEEIYSKGLIAANVNYISIEKIDSCLAVEFRIRHTQDTIPGTVRPLPGGMLDIKFKEPQWAVAPGQAVGIYDGDTVLAGGIIEKSID